MKERVGSHNHHEMYFESFRKLAVLVERVAPAFLHLVPQGSRTTNCRWQRHGKKGNFPPS